MEGKALEKIINTDCHIGLINYTPLKKIHLNHANSNIAAHLPAKPNLWVKSGKGRER